MKAFESREDYLENMLLLGREKGYIRSTDIAQRMNFSKPSVSRAVGLLKASGYLTVNPSDGLITLTSCG
ncbi:MAG: MarR family transcriptional regulator, partial [Pygmaiobacter sp.]